MQISSNVENNGQNHGNDEHDYVGPSVDLLTKELKYLASKQDVRHFIPLKDPRKDERVDH